MQENFCLCGSGIEYDQCCGMFHSGDKSPTTAETLMRSRFTAYALDKTDYILATWDASVHPEKMDFSNENLDWQRLEIISTKKGGTKDNKGIVEFKAFYLNSGEEYMLHEISRFTKSNGRWFYVDGVVKKVGKIIHQSNQGKNAPCSCGSGKKFKRCCGAE
ncbi:MAG: YchJ family protein [Methyloglobulus sp.]|nr:YchJ family protein [Methyloglobulus sp.]